MLIEMEDTSKPYFCSYEDCSMRFSRPSRLQWHMRQHTGEKPFACTITGCDKAYATTTKLRRHLRVYHKLTEIDKPLIIPEGATDDSEKPASDTTSFTDGDIHADSRSNSQQDSALATTASSDSGLALVPSIESCEIASTITADTGSMISSPYGSCSNLELLQLYKYKCTEEGCGRAFKRRSNLCDHKVKHHEKRFSFSCPHEGCDKVFQYPTLLKRHQKTHEGYSCQQCGLSFTKWTEVRTHIAQEHKTVHGCPQCNKTFKRPCDLRRHELTHSNTKELFACPEAGCNKSYDRVATLRKHIKAQHHQELPYKCDMCVAAFPYKVNLVRHTKYHEKTTHDEKKSYPAKGHRRIDLVDRLIGEKRPSDITSTAIPATTVTDILEGTDSVTTAEKCDSLQPPGNPFSYNKAEMYATVTHQPAAGADTTTTVNLQPTAGEVTTLASLPTACSNTAAPLSTSTPAQSQTCADLTSSATELAEPQS